jgi:HD-like signal output (HDOD) protein
MIIELQEIDKKKQNYFGYLKAIRNLPSVPHIVFEVARLLDDPMTSASELGKIIGNDQGLVAKVLTVANSPLYGIPRRVSTIEFAIVILGFDHIKNIVTALSMFESFKSKNENNWNKRSYWLHSIVTATAAKRISDELGYPRSGEAFTAALLHDLGIAVIQRYFNDEFMQICELSNGQEFRHLNAEQSIMGITHQEIGQFLTDKWNLPGVLGETILHHHFPSQAENNKELAAIVHLADYMTHRFRVDNFGWDNNYQLDEQIINILNLGDFSYFNKFVDSYEKLFRNQIDSLIK